MAADMHGDLIAVAGVVVISLAVGVVVTLVIHSLHRRRL